MGNAKEKPMEYELHQQEKDTRRHSKSDPYWSHAALLKREEGPQEEIEEELNIYHPADFVRQREENLLEEQEWQRSKAPLGMAFLSALGIGWLLKKKKKKKDSKVAIKKLTKGKRFAAKNLVIEKDENRSPVPQGSI